MQLHQDVGDIGELQISMVRCLVSSAAYMYTDRVGVEATSGVVDNLHKPLEVGEQLRHGVIAFAEGIAKVRSVDLQDQSCLDDRPELDTHRIGNGCKVLVVVSVVEIRRGVAGG